MPEADWIEVGGLEELKRQPLQEVICGSTKLALSYKDREFGVISRTCNHAGGPWVKAPATATMSSVPGFHRQEKSGYRIHSWSDALVCRREAEGTRLWSSGPSKGGWAELGRETPGPGLTVTEEYGSRSAKRGELRWLLSLTSY